MSSTFTFHKRDASNAIQLPWFRMLARWEHDRKRLSVRFKDSDEENLTIMKDLMTISEKATSQMGTATDPDEYENTRRNVIDFQASEHIVKQFIEDEDKVNTMTDLDWVIRSVALHRLVLRGLVHKSTYGKGEEPPGCEQGLHHRMCLGGQSKH